MELKVYCFKTESIIPKDKAIREWVISTKQKFIEHVGSNGFIHNDIWYPVHYFKHKEVVDGCTLAYSHDKVVMITSKGNVKTIPLI